MRMLSSGIYYGRNEEVLSGLYELELMLMIVFVVRMLNVSSVSCMKL